MADDVNMPRLIALLEVSTRKYTRALEKAQTDTAKNLGDIEKRTSGMRQKVEGEFSKMRLGGRGINELTEALNRAKMAAGALGLAIGGVEIARAVAGASAEYTRLNNALKVAGLTGNDVQKTFAELMQVAMRQGAAVGPLVELYGKMTQSQKELNASGADMMRFTEGVALALRVAGTDAQQASGALLQLSQLLGSGRVQAEEFNSVNEGARPILQAVAAGLEEAGGSVAKLKALVNDGKVSSEAFFRAFLAGMPKLEQQASSAAQTVDQAMNRAGNAFLAVVGKLDEVTGASGNAAQNINAVASAIDAIPAYIAKAVKGLADLQAWFNSIGNHPFWSKVNAVMGVTPDTVRKAGFIPTGDVLQPGNRVAEVFQTGTEQGNAGSMSTMYGPQLPKGWTPKVATVSLKDFAVPGAKEKKGGGGGGLSAEEQRFDEVQRTIEALEKQNRVLEAEKATLGQSNAERQKAVDLARLGEVTDSGQRAELEKQLNTRMRLSKEIEAQEAKQQSLNDATKYGGSLLIDAIGDAALNGEKLDEVLKRVAQSLAMAAAKAVLLGEGPLAGLFGTKGSDGAVGGLLGSLVKSFSGFADGGRVVGPGTGRSDSIPARLSRGEFVVNAVQTAKYLPILEAINSGQMARFADGGLVGRSGLMPDLSKLDGGPRVVINNNNGSDVGLATAPGGGLQIDINGMVENALMSSLASNGQVARTLQGMYGLRRMGGR